MIRRIKVPEDRIAVIIGKGGNIRQEIENNTHTKIKVDEDVEIEGEALDVMTAENIVKAISRGFSPENAFELLDEEKFMSMLELPKSENTLKRIRSRLIGAKGKCRRNIEMLTKTKISIYGRTAGIIGKYENVELAKGGINRIVKGVSHSAVYEYLEGHQKDLM